MKAILHDETINQTKVWEQPPYVFRRGYRTKIGREKGGRPLINMMNSPLIIMMKWSQNWQIFNLIFTIGTLKEGGALRWDGALGSGGAQSQCPTPVSAPVCY